MLNCVSLLLYMKNYFKILLVLMSLFHSVQAQTIQPLAPQTNCPNNFFVDYIANAKANNNKDQVTITGQFISSSDSIKDISFYVEKGLRLFEENKQSYKESFIAKMNSALFNYSSKNVYLILNKQDEVLKIRTNSLTTQNNLEIVFNLLYTPQKRIEFILVCEVVFKNGCRYIGKQKIIL